MTEDTVSAKAEGQPVPEVPAATDFLHRAEQAFLTVEQRVIAGIEAWYERHFHKAAVEGRQPLSADDKAALLKSVTDAVAPTKE